MKEKIALFCDVDVKAVITARDVEIGLRSAAGVRRPKAWTRSCCGCWISTRGPRDLSRWSAMLERMQNPRGEVSIGRGRQVRRIRGFLQEPEGSAAARRAGARIEGQHPLDRSRGLRRARIGSGNSKATTASWCPAASASAASKACSTPSATRARARFPISASASACRRMVIEFARNVCGPGRRRFHRVRPGHAASRDLQAARTEGRRRTGRHHAPGRWPCLLSRRQLRAASLRRARDSASATAIATNSIASTKSS